MGVTSLDYVRGLGWAGLQVLVKGRTHGQISGSISWFSRNVSVCLTEVDRKKSLLIFFFPFSSLG